MLTSEFAVLASAHFIALLSPGPDFFLLIGNTSRHGLRSGMGTALGIALANAGYIACVLMGFGLLSRHPYLSMGIRWLGALYLLYLAWAFIKSGRTASPAEAAQEMRPAESLESLWKGVVTGFVSGALNPKNGLFYLGLFSASVSVSTPPAVRWFYGAWMFGVVLGWDLLIAALLRSPLAMRTLWRQLPKIEIGAGVCLGVLGIAVLAAG